MSEYYLILFGMAIAILFLTIYDICYFIRSGGESIPFVRSWIDFIPPVAILVVGLVAFDVSTFFFIDGMCIGYCLYQFAKWMYFHRD